MANLALKLWILSVVKQCNLTTSKCSPKHNFKINPFQPSVAFHVETIIK